MISHHLRPRCPTFSEYASTVYKYLKNRRIDSLSSNSHRINVRINIPDDEGSTYVSSIPPSDSSHSTLHIMKDRNGEYYCLKMSYEQHLPIHETAIGVALSYIFTSEFCFTYGIVRRPQALRGIVNDYEFNNCQFIKMKYIKNSQTLGDLLIDQTVPDDDILTILAYIMAVMQRAFDNLAFTHYDLKTENILVKSYNTYAASTVHMSHDSCMITTRYAITIIDFECSTVTVNGTTVGVTGAESRGIHPGPNPSYDIIRLCLCILFARPHLISVMKHIINLCVDTSDISDDELINIIRTGIRDPEEPQNRTNISDCWCFNVNVTYHDVLLKIKSIMPSLPIKLTSTCLQSLIK